MDDQTRPFKRGVRLNDLDRSRDWVLRYVPRRRRWEVLGPADSLGVTAPDADGNPGAGDAVASTGDRPASGTSPRGLDSGEGP